MDVDHATVEVDVAPPERREFAEPHPGTGRRQNRGLVGSCLDLSIEVIAEGVETEAERDVLVDLGVDLLQGYLFAKPGPAFPAPRFPGG